MHRRASPRLAAIRARLAANSRLATLDAHPISAIPIARRTTRIFVKYYSKKLAERDGPSTAANNAPIEINSDSEEEDPEMDPEGEQNEEADPAMNPRDEQEEEEDPEMDIEEEQEADPEGAVEEVEEEEAKVHHYNDDECEQMYIENYFEFTPSASSDKSNTGPPAGN
ncbi:hypothetical protein PIB30_085450 [Stylosanthes scabra]|uniref:Uncharacterized protein n=1 Tax=Stylosanthes scabra TaxID=79078 RepID=A0ABU6ZRN3_9FABA|nr:hypothetical protein [Stylosanthes scabra]